MQLQQITNSLFLLILFLLPTQLGKHFWPDFTLVRGLRIDYLSPTIYLTDLVIGLLFLFWLYGWKKSSVRTPIKISNPLDWLVTVIGLAALLANIVFSTHQILSLLGLIKLLECFFFGWYSYNTLQNARVKRTAMLVMSLSMLFQSLIALGQYATHGSLGGPLYFFGERTFTADTPGIANAAINGTLVLRPYGTLPHPNVLAGFLLIIGSIIIGNMPQMKKTEKIITMIILGISGVAFLSTLSRTPIALAALMMLSYIIYRLLRHFMTPQHSLLSNHLQTGIVFIPLIILLVAVVQLPIIERFLTTAIAEESLQHRVVLSKAALMMLADHPVFGVGLHTFLSNLPNYLPKTASVSLIQPAHNSLLLIASETGLLGELVVSYCAFRILIAKTVSIISNKIPFFILVILSLTDHFFVTLQQGQLLSALIIGYTLAVTMKTNAD